MNENKFNWSIESSRKRGLYHTRLKCTKFCCFFVKKNLSFYPRERKKEGQKKKVFAQKTKFISLMEFERKWNESVKLSESRDVMTRSVSSRVSLSGSGCCALPELNLARWTTNGEEWNRHQRVFRNFFSSCRFVSRSLGAWMKITRRAVSGEKSMRGG